MVASRDGGYRVATGAFAPACGGYWSTLSALGTRTFCAASTPAARALHREDGTISYADDYRQQCAAAPHLDFAALRSVASN
jgi:hypothetical protein